LVCQANTILPLGTTLPAARRPRTDGIASAVVASAADRNIVRRVTVVLFMFVPPVFKIQPVPTTCHLPRSQM
jgi:hypothetical protein